MRHLLGKYPSFILSLVLLSLMASAAAGNLRAEDGERLPDNALSAGLAPAPAGADSVDTIIPVDAAGWNHFSTTADCAQGWGNDEWHLTLSQPKTLRLRVEDCCCPGDYYSVYVDGGVIGTTPRPSAWGCSYSGTLSSGLFETYLPAGTHVIKVRDVSFPEHSAAEIAYQRMCPAGFEVEGTLLAPPSVPDVALDAGSWKFENDVSPYRPEKLWVSVRAQNVGTATADNVAVRFYLGDPDHGGTQIGTTQSLGSLAAGGSGEATVEWTLNGNVENQRLYARVSTSSDADLANNTVDQRIGVWYVPFRHDVDAYSFDNWALDGTDIRNNLLMFLDVHHPDDISKAFLFPLLYPAWASLTELGGHCYGMSATSALYFDYPEIKPVGKATYAMTRDEARTDIQYYQRHQTTHVIELIIQDKLGFNAEGEYARALESIRDEGVPTMLLMKAEEGGHAVLAYKILDLGSEKRLYLYDNNRPLTRLNTNLYATVNTDTDEFLFDAPYGIDFDQFLAREPLISGPDYAEAMLERFYDWVLRQTGGIGSIRVSLSADLGAAHTPSAQPDTIAVLPAELLIIDQYGRRVGYENGILVNQIPGAMIMTPAGQVVIELPEDLTYSVETAGTTNGAVTLNFLIPESANTVREVTYLEIPVSAGSEASTLLQQDNTEWTLISSISPSQEPDRFVDHQYHDSYLPNVQATSGQVCTGQKVVNPDFEQGPSVGWDSFSSTGRRLISSELPPSYYSRSGSNAAWLGFNHYEVSNLSQAVNSPAEATSGTLTYWYQVASEEWSCNNDLAWLEVNGGILRLFNLCGDGNTAGWVRDTVDMTPYLDAPFTLKFHVQTNGTLRSSLFVEDVTLDVQCTE